MRNPNILLTNDEITIVNNLIWEKPVREVAAKIGRSLMALHYYLKHRDNYPPSAKMIMGSYPSKEKDNKHTFTVPITTTTRITPAKRPKTEPPMSQYQQNERLAFATMYITWSEVHWRKVVFHDERKFNLDGPDGFTHYYHDMRNYERSLSQRPRGGSVFIWIAITFGGGIRCEVSTTKFKSEAFIEFLQSERTNIAAKLDGNADFVLQDHYNSFQNLTTLQNWSDVKGIKAQQWPNIAHDVDIMENVWGWLIREVYDSGRRYSRKDDLVLAIQMAWAQLPLHFIQNLYSTMPERVMELYYTKGIYTNC